MVTTYDDDSVGIGHKVDRDALTLARHWTVVKVARHRTAVTVVSRRTAAMIHSITVMAS